MIYCYTADTIGITREMSALLLAAARARSASGARLLRRMASAPKPPAASAKPAASPVTPSAAPSAPKKTPSESAPAEKPGVVADAGGTGGTGGSTAAKSGGGGIGGWLLLAATAASAGAYWKRDSLVPYAESAGLPLGKLLGRPAASECATLPAAQI
jgi:hypothetical protein